MLLAKTNQVDMESTNLNRSELEENKQTGSTNLERIIIFICLVFDEDYSTFETLVD